MQYVFDSCIRYPGACKENKHTSEAKVLFGFGMVLQKAAFLFFVVTLHIQAVLFQSEIGFHPD